ncbi:MAG: carbonic anhydrase [Desulfitobacterium hafniense]|nr:carbonic anhydrase [Desulfitobacterium hafniense]
MDTEHLKVPLVLVLGHEKCGAVTAALEGGKFPGTIGAIVEKIKPAINQVKDTTLTKEAIIEKCTELNVQNAIRDISQSPIIKHALGENLKLYGGKYHLETGEVKWLER